MAKKKLNERITEDIVREHFKKDKLYSTINFEEQISQIPKINKLLKNASKQGNGRGMPEFIISIDDENNLLIVVECKADILKHESENRDKYSDYAVDGALLYSSFLSKEYDVLSLAVSGIEKDNIKVSYFIQRAGKDISERIFGNRLITIDDIISGLKQDKEKREEKYEELLDYSKDLNQQLHKLKIKEDKRSLLVSGILIALDNKDFYRSYISLTSNKMLANTLVTTIEEQLQNEDLQGDKINKLMQNYSFINSHPSLINNKKTKDLKDLKDLIDDIDENINGYARTYKYYDVLGQFYIEFLRYSNSDKGLGIVLTPPHITDFFTEIVDIKTDDIVLDNCTGTSGFLVSSMKKMIDKCNGDLLQEESIKKTQLYGIEYQPEMYPLAVSNMFLHGDGKSNIISGSCFDEEIVNTVKDKKPTIGFLNPPYKSDKKEDIEEFEFILNSLSCLTKHGQCVAIVPMSCVLAQSGERLRLKEELLSKHTLKAVFTMPNELFNNSKVSTNTCIIVIEAHIPHPIRKETFFGYFKDDGFYKRKTKGRFDYDKKWDDIKDEWLNLYVNSREQAGFSKVKKVKAEDEWCAEAYMETDYSALLQDDFQKVINNYIAFKVEYETY
ncbi:MAG: N-6 DNA methylase [Campylobacterota bacterium]|nr:N-6 DNA methylase [Campylobacterota bacterium]